MQRRIFFSAFSAMLLALWLVLLSGLLLLWTISGITAETSRTSLIGKWEGRWDFGLKAELIIKQLKGNKAEAIYMWDDFPKYKIRKGKIYVSANLITAPAPGIKWTGRHGRSFKFLMNSDNRLKGTCVWRKWHNAIEMTKVSSAP